MNSLRIAVLSLVSLIGQSFATPPIPLPDSYSTTEDSPLIVPAAGGVLANDNPNGHPQIEGAVVVQPAHGTLALNSDGSFIYTPAPNYNGPDSFTYKARNYVAPHSFDIDPALSVLTMSVRAHGSVISPQTRSDTSMVDGTVTVGVLEPKTTGPFTAIRVTDLDAVLIEQIELHYNFGFLVGTADISAAPGAITLSMDAAGPTVPVGGSGLFTQTGNTLAADGTVHVAYSGILIGNGSSDEPLNHATGVSDFANASILSNGTVMTLTLPVAFTKNDVVIDATNGILADITITGTIKGTAPANLNLAEESAPVTVSLTVISVNDPPVAVADSYVTRQAVPLTIAAAPTESTEELVPAGSVWKYRYDGVNYGTAWKDWVFNSTSWPSGSALLGHGDPDIVTSIRPAGTPNHVTAYFRREFTVTDASNTRSGVKLYIKRDDGAAVYLNGVEVFRDSNLPAGAAFGTYTTSTRPDTEENIFVEVDVSRTLLFEGKNVLAVEVHQATAASSDLRFDCRLTRPLGAPGVIGNDVDVDTPATSLTASLLELPAHGSVTLNPNGGFTYTPASGYIGPDSFAYAISDGGGGATEQLVVPRGSLWSYLDNGSNPGANWRDGNFDDSLWFIGSAELGYGDGDEATLISPVPVVPAYFFRRKFAYAGDKAFVGGLIGRIRRDDAAAVYFNGQEVYRDASLPQNPAFDFYCGVSTPSETTFVEFSIPVGLFLAGENTVAVEVHQASAASSDVSFDMELSAVVLPGSRATVAVLNDDADLDGLSDTWERANGFNYGSADDAELDSDSDGVSNRLEFLALTDPRNGASFFRSGGVARTGGNLDLSFSGVSTGRSYQLESSTTLAGWVPLGAPFTPSGTSVTIGVPFSPAVPRELYRLRVNYSFP